MRVARRRRRRRSPSTRSSSRSRPPRPPSRCRARTPGGCTAARRAGPALAVGSPLLSVATAGSSSPRPVRRRRTPTPAPPATSRPPCAVPRGGAGRIRRRAHRLRHRRDAARPARRGARAGTAGGGPCRRRRSARGTRRRRRARSRSSRRSCGAWPATTASTCALTPAVAGRDPAPPRRGGGDRPVAAGLPGAHAAPRRRPPEHRARTVPDARRPSPPRAAAGPRRPAHPAARRPPGRRRPADPQPARDPRRDHLGRRRRDRADGGRARSGGRDPTPASACWRCIARFVVAGLRRFPELNARVDTEREEIVQLARVNLGFAAQSPRGLVVPVVHDAGLDDDLASWPGARASSPTAPAQGTLTPAQMTGGTFTLNNYGVFGVDGSTPIINHPEAAILGIGRIIDKPWVVDGQLPCARSPSCRSPSTTGSATAARPAASCASSPTASSGRSPSSPTCNPPGPAGARSRRARQVGSRASRSAVTARSNRGASGDVRAPGPPAAMAAATCGWSPAATTSAR